MEPSRLFPIIVLLSLVTVEYGGRALLGFLTGRGTLAAFREQFFAAGHTHVGVLLVLSLAYIVDREIWAGHVVNGRRRSGSA
jgi:hypothetical protein